MHRTEQDQYPLVSIITPTHKRPHLHEAIHRCVLSQSWPNWEWLLDDDSDTSSEYFAKITDPRISYRHDTDRRTLGAKRNGLIERASGEYIVHFDDDDFYSSEYIARMITRLEISQADLVKLSGMFIYHQNDRELYYWNVIEDRLMFYTCMPGYPLMYNLVPKKMKREGLKQRLGYGFSFVYKRSLWEKAPYPDRQFGEDLSFVVATIDKSRIAYEMDTSGLCLHIIHSANLSGCFPQYLLPSFFLEKIFPGVSEAQKLVPIAAPLEE
jgi:glycosyltransferase involved in cell wall biosynthesis